MRAEGAVTLADGRTLGLARRGPAGGDAVLYLHGTPGSRLEFVPPDALLERYRAQVIALERPGYGRSSPPPPGGHTRFAADVAQAMAQLGIERFDVVGFSGGGPYALACAAALGARVRRVWLAGGLAPVTTAERLEGMNPLAQETYRVAQTTPERLPGLLEPLLADIPGLTRQLIDVMGPADRAWLRHPFGFGDFAANVAEALRAGAVGTCHDIGLATRPWDFVLAAVRQPVTLLHGAADTSVPPAHARYLAAALPNARLRLIDGQAHYVLFTPEHVSAVLSDASE